MIQRLIGKRRWFCSLIGVLGVTALASTGRPQAVEVTLTLDTNVVQAGQTTQLRVWAQVVPSLRTNAERIATWYVDLLNLDGAVAAADYDMMAKTASDNDPSTSSTGFDDGDHRRAIYDTFLDASKSGIGVTNPVELLSVPVTGLAGGTVEFQVAAGSGEPLLSQDFIVAPAGGGDPLLGGDYGAASATLTVEQACALELQIDHTPDPGVLLLSFEPCAGFDHTVEFADEVTTNTFWSPLPGAPHNSGMVNVTNTVSPRFYRVRADLP